VRIVVKIGGAQLEQAGARETLARALARARAAGHELLVVHGGGNQIRKLSARLGLEDRYVAGLRVTDAATAPLVLMVLAGEVNRWLVASLERAGVPAVGLCGADGGLFAAKKLCPDGQDIGYVGEVALVRTKVCDDLLAAGWTPVVATVGPLASTEAGDPTHFYNINADQAAAPLARAVHADALLFLTDVEGVLGAEGERLPRLTPTQVARLRAAGILRGGMLPKVAAALDGARALPAGLVKIAPAAGRDAVLDALDADHGTRFDA
jgi:acetylglutamate kinase